jgi:hypothetical protein
MRSARSRCTSVRTSFAIVASSAAGSVSCCCCIVAVPFLRPNGSLGAVTVDHLQQFLQRLNAYAMVSEIMVLIPAKLFHEHPFGDPQREAGLQLHYQQGPVRRGPPVNARQLTAVQRVPAIVHRRSRRYMGIMTRP